MKIDKVEDLRIKTGSLFHSAGPASANALLPSFLSDRVTTKSPCDDERSPRLDWGEEQGVTSEERYAGEQLV